MANKITHEQIRLARRNGRLWRKALDIHDKRCDCGGVPIDDDFEDAIRAESRRARK